MEEQKKECCDTCRKKRELTKYDYSKGGCLHTDYEGYACLAFEKDGMVIHMIGNDPAETVCGSYLSIEKRVYTYINRKKKRRKRRTKKKEETS